MQGLKREQVRVLQDIHKDFTGERSLLRVANPENNTFYSLQAWKEDGVRVVIITPRASVGVDGLQFIKHLVLYTPPHSSLRQLFGRFDRPASR